jgi:deoxycytidylate deaminase
MHQNYYTLEASKEAQKSLIPIASHGAVVIHRGKIIGRGFNKMCVPCVNRVNHYSIHAEVNAIQDALKKVDKNCLQKSSLVVVRINKNGETLNSYPCKQCRDYISRIGIKTAYYS